MFYVARLIRAVHKHGNDEKESEKQMAVNVQLSNASLLTDSS